MLPKEVIYPLYKFYDLSTRFIKYLSIIGDYLIINNIFLDKAYEIFIYLFKSIDQIIVNHDKCRDITRWSFVPKVVPQL
jgi:hypothetical protein